MSKLVALIITLASLAGCGSEPLSRTGTTTTPVTLTAAWGQGPTGVGGDILARLVEGTADGAVRVVSPLPPDVEDTAAERHAVEAVLAGEADMTVVRAGLLDLLGAASLRPLGAPFSVTNHDQAVAISSDPELSADLLSGLAGIGLVGLGLVPGGLRHPFAFGSSPLLGPEDYRGKVINVREDAGVRAMLAQLGATADHSINGARHLAAGRNLRGMEVSVQQLGAVPLPATQTANVTLYVKFDVGVVSAETWDGLSPPQRQELQASFKAAVAAAVSSRISEEEGQAAWCRTAGARSVLAASTELAELHRALAPVTQRIAEDPDASGVLNRVRLLHAGTREPSAQPCAPVGSDPDATYRVTPKGDQSVLDGLWRLQVEKQAILDAGLSAQDAAANAGVWEFRIKDGYADGVQPDGRPCNAQFSIDGAQVSVDFGVRGVEECGGLARGTYRLEGNRAFFDWSKELEYDVALDRAMFAPGMVRIS